MSAKEEDSRGNRPLLMVCKEDPAIVGALKLKYARCNCLAYAGSEKGGQVSEQDLKIVGELFDGAKEDFQRDGYLAPVLFAWAPDRPPWKLSIQVHPIASPDVRHSRVEASRKADN